MQEQDSLVQKIVSEYKELGYSPTEEAILKMDWKWFPVGVDQFLDDDFYLGKFGKSVYPRWREDLSEVLQKHRVSEWILTGAIGGGKTTAASIALAYKLYELSCLKNPQNFYGLMDGSPIVYGLYNIFLYKAEDDNYGVLESLVYGSPYFRKYFPTKKMLDIRRSSELRFPGNVFVVAGSSKLHALGQNLFSLLIDEVNFMRGDVSTRETQKSQAQQLFDACKRRLESRFMYRGMIPGIMILISSRNAETSWLERHLAEVRGRKDVYVSDYAIWEVKPKELYSGKTFRVEVGDSERVSRILSEGDKPTEGSRVLEVPVEYYDSFKNNIEEALRDLGGVASLPYSPFIRTRSKLESCIDSELRHPFSEEVIKIGLHSPENNLIEKFLEEESITIQMGIPRPKLGNAVRHIHCDLSETTDAVGIAMGWVSGWDEDEGVVVPKITMDFVLRVVPYEGDSIDFGKIRNFILYLRNELGYPIRSVSFDQFQSTDSRQILYKLGFVTDVLSVDRTSEPYMILRNFIYSGRVRMYRYDPLWEELTNLWYDSVKDKVDHPQYGSKDVSDALCAVVYWLVAHQEKRKNKRYLGPAANRESLLNAVEFF